MKVIKVRNVVCALPEGLRYLSTNGVTEQSRAGVVTMSPSPVTTVYENPQERVLFDPLRDANPFFHFMEGLWMIGGRDDVEWISKFSSGIAKYSDDGKIFHGAYGRRWRSWFSGMDQLTRIINGLKDNPSCRRQILQMWDPIYDLGQEGKDFPCNQSAHFQIIGGRLNMTVFNRSNDAVWGAYGANAVHFSMLQEYMAGMIGVPMGRYWQISDNFHVYEGMMGKKGLWELAHKTPDGHIITEYDDPYRRGEVQPYPMMGKPEHWEADLNMFLRLGTECMGYHNAFFRRVAIPMLRAWNTYKDGDKKAAIRELKLCTATDWKKACQEWLTRRLT